MSSQSDTLIIPEHVAIIMDGNGRWAADRELDRTEGHRAGTDAARTVIQTCAEMGVKVLTLYSFSTENWNCYFRTPCIQSNRKFGLSLP